jgi:hypothetical protein
MCRSVVHARGDVDLVGIKLVPMIERHEFPDRGMMRTCFLVACESSKLECVPSLGVYCQIQSDKQLPCPKGAGG